MLTYSYSCFHFLTFISQLISESTDKVKIPTKRETYDLNPNDNTQRSKNSRQRRDLFRDIKANLYHKSNQYQTCKRVKDFIEKIVDRDGGLLHFQKPNEDVASSRDSEKSQIFTSTKSEIEEYYEKIILKIYGSESRNEELSEDTDKLAYFENHKIKILLETIDKKAKIIFDKFWKIFLEEKITTNNLENKIKILYENHNSDRKLDIEYKYIKVKLSCFSVKKYDLETNDETKEKILNILNCFCKLNDINNFFRLSNNKSDSSNQNLTSNTPDYSKGSLISPENERKLLSLEHVFNIETISHLCIELKTWIVDVTEFYYSHKFITEINSLKFDFYKIYVSIMILQRITKISTFPNENNEFLSVNSSFISKTILLNATATTIIVYRNFFELLVNSIKRIQRFKIEDNSRSAFKLSKKFTCLYTNFLFFMTLFTIVDSLIPTELRELCLDSNSNLLNIFFLLHLEDPIHEDKDSHIERKNMFKKIQHELFNETVIKCETMFDILYKNSNNFISDRQDYKHLVNFLMTIISIREYHQYLLDFNLSALQNIFPDSMQGLFSKEKEMIKAKIKENMKKIEEQDFKKFFGKIEELSTKKKCYSILFLVDLLSHVEKESLDISEQYKRLEFYFIPLKSYTKDDLDELIRISMDFKIFISPQMEIFDFNYLNIFKLMAFDTLHSNLSGFFKNGTPKNFNIVCVEANQYQTADPSSSDQPTKKKLKLESKVQEEKGKVSIVYVFFELFIWKLIRYKTELGFNNIFSNEDKKRMGFFFAIINYGDRYLSSRIIWYMVFDNLQDLFRKYDSNDVEILNFQKTSPVAFVTEIYFYIEEWIFVFILLSEVEIKVKNSSQNKSPDNKNLIKNYIFITKGKAFNDKKEVTGFYREYSKKIRKIYIARSDSAIDFDTFLQQINEMLDCSF